MLVLERRTGQSVLIYPSDDIDPEMTVAELFSRGPIRIAVRCRDHTAVKLAIEAPGTVKVIRDELKK